MTELQNVEFQILKSFVDVCDKLGLTYYLVCGTALGAAKYGGFIPWDDDIDVGMYREDYEIFCQKAPRLLPEYYFLQTYRTDKNFPHIFCKIRDSRTTYIEKSVAGIVMHHGVYIDVFPLDGYPEIPSEKLKLERKKRLLQAQIACVFQINAQYSRKAKLIVAVGRFLGFHKQTNRILQKLETLLAMYQTTDASIICNHGNWQGKLEYAPKEQYGKGSWTMFEGLKVRIPEKFDEYLTQKYGDWRSDPPKEEQIGHHFYEVCDLSKPYTEYLKCK